jgi:hypothetical protein
MPEPTLTQFETAKTFDLCSLLTRHRNLIGRHPLDRLAGKPVDRVAVNDAGTRRRLLRSIVDGPPPQPD